MLHGQKNCFIFQTKLEDGGLENVTTLEKTALRSNAMYVTFYVFWSKFILVEVIPYCTIVILNSLIVIKIWKSIQFRKKLAVSIIVKRYSFTDTTYECLRNLVPYNPSIHCGIEK